MGFLPGGIIHKDLTIMMGNRQWVQQKDQLIRASLLQQRYKKQGIQFYNLLPFMGFRAAEMMDENQEGKMVNHQKICKFYKNFCKQIYNSPDKVFSYLEELTENETNIWASIYRGINRKKDIKFEEVDRGRSNSVRSLSSNHRDSFNHSSSIL